MDATAEASLKTERTREELLLYLDRKDYTFTAAEELLKRYRSSCIDFIFLDFRNADLKRTEKQLWDAHGVINNKFRALLARFRDGEGKKKYVERRKLEKSYLDFVKGSMAYYRGFLLRLASHFGGVPQISEVAQKFGLDTSSMEPSIQVGNHSELESLLLASSYDSLIRLGDLSRYRETELVLKDRNWGPAKRYYDLARSLKPESWQSFNAMAVIALKDEDHFGALYYLHRATAVPLTSESSRPGFKNLPLENLELDFKKILERLARKRPIVSQNEDPNLYSLQVNFAAFHARAFMDPAFPRFAVLEADILKHLEIHLRDGPTDKVINKMCLVNIEGLDLVRQSLKKSKGAPPPEGIQRHNLLQGLNIQTFSLLLNLVLKDTNRSGPVSAAGDASQDEFLPTMTRRILPTLRHYSTWLMAEIPWLASQDDPGLVSPIRKFWKSYVRTLNSLISRFTVTTYPELDYLLEEDVDTIGFTPLGGPNKYFGPDGTSKPKFSDPGIHRSLLGAESCFRIKTIVKDAVKLLHTDFAKLGLVPFAFSDGQFKLDHPESSLEAQPQHLSNGEENGNTSSQDVNFDFSDTSTHLSEAMHEMVDALVENDTSDISQNVGESEYGPKSPNTRHEPAFSTSASVNPEDLVRQLQRSPNFVVDETSEQAVPTPLSTIWTPRPGETSSRPGTSHCHSSNISTGQFQEAISAQQQQLQMRASPQHFLPSSLASYDQTPVAPRQMTPIGLGLGLGLEHPASSSPWPTSSPVRFESNQNGDCMEEKKLPQRALFGAIGERTPRQSSSGRIPTSYQPG